MSFKRYSSIDNSYRTKEINYWKEHNPTLENETFILQEKIHGSNIQLVFSPNQEMQVGKRSALIPKGENFYDVWNVLKSMTELTDAFAKLSNEQNQTIHLYGEIFGQGVQKGVDYNVEGKRILFFDMRIDGQMQPIKSLEDVFQQLGFSKYLVPVVAIVEGLSAAIDWKVDFPTMLNPVEGNNAEGFVVKPYNRTYTSLQGSIFYLKKKSEKFEERFASPKEKKELDPETLELADRFVGYINDNRLQGIFSKEGEISDINDFGKYMKWLMEDARVDFLKDNPDVELVKDVWKIGGKEATNLIRQYL